MLIASGTMASADFSPLLRGEISHGKYNLFPLILPDIRFSFTDVFGASLFIARLPRRFRLVSDSYSSKPTFATGFLQIPIHNGHPCPSLTIPRRLGSFGTYTLERLHMHGTLTHPARGTDGARKASRRLSSPQSVSF